MNQPPEISEMLSDWSNGDSHAIEKLMPHVYDELHKQARRFMRRESADHTLQTSALVNEAYLKLKKRNGVNFENRSHFFAIASQIMRRILVDYARAKNRKKRGGEVRSITLDEAIVPTENSSDVDLVALDQALKRLAAFDERQAKIVELKYFGGMTLVETAEVLSVSRSTVAQEWTAARAWLHRELTQ